MADNIIGFDGALFSTSNISATSSFMVNNVFVMNNTSLGSSVVNSNIQSLGVLLNLKVSGNSTMSTLYTTNVNSNNLFSNVGTISTLYTGNLSTGAINVANLTSTNSNITTGTVSTLKSTNLTSSNANITTSTVSTLYSSTASVSNLSSTNSNITTGTVATLYSSTASVTNLSSSNSNITTGTVGSLYVTSSVNTNLYASCGTVGTLYTGSLSAGTTPLLLTSQSVIVNSNQTPVQRQYPSQLNPTAGAAGTSSGNSFYQFSVSGQTYGNGNYIYNTAVGVYDSWGTYSMLSNVVSTGSGAFQINPGVSDYNDYDIAANDGNGTFTYNSNRSYIVTYDTNNVAYRGLYLQIQLPSPINITGVGVLSDSAAAPRSMYVLASNNGTTWTLIYNIYRYITGWNLPTINIIPIVPTVGTAFNYYRFVVYEVGSFKAVHMGRFLLYDNTPNTTTLGVNTSNPAYTLDVNGVVNATNYKISGTDVLNGTTLGSTVVNSSLQNLGTLSELNVSGNANITSGTVGTLYTSSIKTGTSKYNITLPNAAPTATNMVLATTSNSSNPQLVWAAANSLVTPSQWTTGGNDISYTTGNVGIGTASISPNMVLDVYGSSSTTNGALLLRNDTTAIKVLPYTNSAYFQFGNPSSAVYPGTPSSVPFYITNFNAGSTYISVVPTSSGATNTANIGINTATPNTALHVNGAVTLAGLSSASQSYVLGYNQSTGLVTYQSASAATQWTTSGSNITYASGNVGIGTNAPQSALDIMGTEYIRDASGTGVIKQGVVYGNGYIQMGLPSSLTSPYTASSAPLYFTNFNAGSYYMSIIPTSSGATNTANIGINTATPNTALHVNGAVTLAGLSSASQSYVLGYNQSTGLVTYQSASAATQWTTGTGNIYYTSGYVGIGIANPTSASLQVAGTVITGQTANGSSTTGYIVLQQGTALNTAYTAFHAADGTRRGYVGWADSYFLYLNSGNIGLSFGSDQGTAMVILYNKYVGIGTNNPSYPFHVNSSTVPAAAITGGTAQYLRVNEAYFQYWDANTCAVVGVLNAPSSLYVKNNGYVGIGTPTPQFPLDVANSVAWSTGYPYQVYSLGMPAGTEQVYSIRGSYSFWTFYGGYLSSSDRRKKTNINNADTSTALGKILSLPLKTYNYIDKVADGDELVYGLIAQEVKEIMPEAITLGTAYIPSIYKLATDIELSEDETNVIITVDIPETSELKVGGKVELVVENMKEKHNAIVVSFTSYELVVPKWDDFDDTKNVFVVGPEINDYHTLDKPYLAVVCMGGIQELSAMNDTLTERVTALETTNTTLQQQIATLNQLVSSLIDKVNSLSPQ